MGKDSKYLYFALVVVGILASYYYTLKKSVDFLTQPVLYCSEVDDKCVEVMR
jgi:hypothetical protein